MSHGREELKWWETAEIIGVTDRTMRGWLERYEEFGPFGAYATGFLNDHAAARAR